MPHYKQLFFLLPSPTLRQYWWYLVLVKSVQFYKNLKYILGKAVLSETNSKSVWWHGPGMFFLHSVSRNKDEILYQNPLKDISAMLTDRQLIPKDLRNQSHRISESSSGIAVGAKQVFN